jgi:hypothetical protein
VKPNQTLPLTTQVLNQENIYANIRKQGQKYTHNAATNRCTHQQKKNTNTINLRETKTQPPTQLTNLNTAPSQKKTRRQQPEKHQNDHYDKPQNK